MDKVYLPKSLMDANLPPVFNHQDIIYMRFIKDGNIVRVARADPVKGLVLELYPTKDSDKLEGEGFCRIEDRSERRVLEKSRIRDSVWLAILGNTDIPALLSEYPVEMLGMYPSGSYKYGEGDQYRTFHIIEIEEP